jgi:sec-independent protein translocase protein TatC
MAKVLRPIGHEDRLSIIDHLDELRSRLFVCGIGLAVAFAFCFWQNQVLLKALNRALPATPSTSSNHISGLTGDSVKEAHALNAASSYLHQLANSGSQTAHDKALFGGAASALASAASSLPSQTAKRLPITIGVGEPFTTTLLAAAYFALLLTLPLIIYQAYAFVIPALNPQERRVAIPVMLIAPVLFLIGVAFAYFVVLPPAVHFLQGYNSGNFDILVQAKTYYQFQIFTMLGIGLIFQLPLGLLALHSMGRVTARTLTRNWRYATVIIAVIAAALPGADPVTTGLETLPLVILYLASIVMLKIADRRAAARAAEEPAAEVSQGFDAP